MKIIVYDEARGGTRSNLKWRKVRFEEHTVKRFPFFCEKKPAAIYHSWAMWNLCRSENEILNVLGSRCVGGKYNFCRCFCCCYSSWYKKQLDNKREHSGTEQMSSNLKAQLEEVIKKKFKFSNDDNDVDGDDDEKDFCLSIFFVKSTFYSSLSYLVSIF